jgi:uncharacterized protein
VLPLSRNLRDHSADAGATVYRGILGYGTKRHTHKQSFFHVARDLPIMISVVESGEKLNQAATVIEEMLHDGLIVVSDVEIVRLVHSSPLCVAKT